MRNLILGLARPVLRLLRRDERGAVGVLIVVLISGGVLLGMGALAIDVGQLYQNRAELQNGADAGALAVAKSCASGACSPGTAMPLAQALADGNASKLTGGLAAVDLICGSGGLGACPASTGALTACPPPPSGSANYVDVYTSTKTPSGSLLPPVFSRMLLGNASYQGTSVKACAQAEWGPPQATPAMALTISACEWDQATSQGGSFAPTPPNAPVASFDQVLKLHTTTSGNCPSEPSGADGPGAFGWTDGQSGCTVDITGGTYGADTGVSAGKSCEQALSAAQSSHTPVFIPIYTTITGHGTNCKYSLKGYAAFVVTGYSLPGFSSSDWLNPANNCKGSDKCVNGYFTQDLVPAPGNLGGANLGATIVRLTG